MSERDDIDKWTPGLKKTRTGIWLKVNGKVDSLNRHFMSHGYRNGYASTPAHRWKRKQSDIPIEGWREFFGEDCHFCERPKGSARRTVSFDVHVREKGQKDRTGEERKRDIVLRGPAIEFATMRLPCSIFGQSGYY